MPSPNVVEGALYTLLGNVCFKWGFASYPTKGTLSPWNPCARRVAGAMALRFITPCQSVALRLTRQGLLGSLRSPAFLLDWLGVRFGITQPYPQIL